MLMNGGMKEPMSEIGQGMSKEKENLDRGELSGKRKTNRSVNRRESKIVSGHKKPGARERFVRNVRKNGCGLLFAARFNSNILFHGE